MPEPDQGLFSSDFFMPHGHCYLWRPGLLALQVITNGLMDIAELFRTTAAHFDGIARERGIRFEVRVAETVTAELDVAKVERVLLNVLSNAFKFTPNGGTIVCELYSCEDSQRGSLVQLRVSDSGPGIAANMREAIFERFHQIDEGPTRALGGIGLGLAICKEFVELFHGRIEVGDSSHGGASFSITLPSKAPSNASVRKASGVHRVADGEQARLALNDFETRVSLVVPPPSGRRPLVLVIEDNRDMRHFICQTLSDTYRTISASDGREGLNKALEFPPDLVLSDIMMPHMGGDELLRELRDREESKMCPSCC